MAQGADDLGRPKAGVCANRERAGGPGPAHSPRQLGAKAHRPAGAVGPSGAKARVQALARVGAGGQGRERDRRQTAAAMIDQADAEVEPLVGTAPTCRAPHAAAGAGATSASGAGQGALAGRA